MSSKLSGELRNRTKPRTQSHYRHSPEAKDRLRPKHLPKGGAGNLVGQAFAAFEAAAFQNEATGMSGVSLHEAVFLLPLALVRLIRAFWHKINPI